MASGRPSVAETGVDRRGVVVALGAARGGWVVADRIAAEPVAPPPAQKVFVSGPARLQVSTRAGRARRGRRPSRARGRAAPMRPTPGCRPRSRSRSSRRNGRARAGRARGAGQGGLPKGAARARRRPAGARDTAGVKTGERSRDVYAIPTTRGVLTLVCSARIGARGRRRGASSGLDQITVEGARPIEISAGTAYRMRAPRR